MSMKGTFAAATAVSTLAALAPCAAVQADAGPNARPASVTASAHRISASGALQAGHAVGAVISRHKVDVDGDSRADTVTVRRASVDTTSVTVTTAKRRTSRMVVEYAFVYPPKTPFYGAAHLDGVAGEELVITTMTSNHTMFFDVLTWRANRLVRLPSPAAPRAGWAIDGYYGGAASVRVTGKRSAMRLVFTDSEITSHRRYLFRTTTRTYAWRAGSWKHVGTTRRTEPGGKAPSGWYVKGLPRYRMD